MSKFAEGTSVAVDKSIAEIKKTTQRFGADGFQLTEGHEQATVAFIYQGRMVRMGITLPDRADDRFTKTPGLGRLRTKEQVFNEWEKECRRKWRELALLIKAMLVAVDSNVVTFDEVFMPFLVGLNGMTIGQAFAPRVEEMIQSGKVPTVSGLLAGKGE